MSVTRDDEAASNCNLLNASRSGDWPISPSLEPLARWSTDAKAMAMSRSEIEQVLRNWVEQAMSPTGTFAEGVDPVTWVADNFVGWWRTQAEEALASAESCAGYLEGELKELRDQEEAYEAIDAMSGLQDALTGLRRSLGFTRDLAEGE